jgi:hypothetical protein
LKKTKTAAGRAFAKELENVGDDQIVSISFEKYESIFGEPPASSKPVSSTISDVNEPDEDDNDEDDNDE